MRRALVLLLVLLTQPVWSAVGITITSPSPGAPVFGMQRFAVAVDAGNVTFYVDGEVVGHRDAPPYEVEVNVGEANASHRFEAVVETADGQRASAQVVTPAIRIDLEVELALQQLYVTVSREGARVLDLGRDAFTLLDDGARQEIVTFERGDVPLVAVLLVDGSASMRGARLTAALSGAQAFIAGMRPLDQAKLLLFSDHVLHTTPFTNFAEVLTAGLDGVAARGGTALNDHLYLALKGLEARQGRRVVILLSDGIDVESVLSMRQVLAQARRSPALIYWLRLGAEDPRVGTTSAWRNTTAHRAERDHLTAAVEASGGRILTLTSLDDTAAAFATILEELRGQYVLGYYPSANRDDGSWHRIAVRVRGPGLRVRARAGYVDE